MRTAVLTGPRNMIWEERPIPAVKGDEVLVRVEYTGICGSDLHRYHDAPGWITPYPVVLGHECSGTVVATGSDVTTLQEGDRVVLEPFTTCGVCQFCRDGRYHLCKKLRAIPLHFDGAFSEYIAFPAIFTHKVPDDMDLRLAALVEPVAVSLHAVRMCNAEPGKVAAVLGAGPIGLLAVMLLQYYGISDITVTDVLESRLEMAHRLGTATYNIRNGRDQKHRCIDAVDIVIEASGNPAAIKTAVEMVAPGGTICMVGVPRPVEVDLFRLFSKEASIKTSYKYSNDYPVAIEILSARTLPWLELITDDFPFDELPEAMRYTSENPEKCLKTMIRMMK